MNHTTWAVPEALCQNLPDKLESSQLFVNGYFEELFKAPPFFLVSLLVCMIHFKH